MLAAVPSDREPKFASALSPKERRALRQTSEPVWHSGDGCAYMAPVAPPIGVGPVTGGEHLMPEWAEVRRAGIERAERTLAARSDIAELVKLVVGWLEETRPSHSSSSRGLGLLQPRVCRDSRRIGGVDIASIEARAIEQRLEIWPLSPIG